jgi:lipocalin
MKMKSTIKWHKELVGGKWYSVANVEHIPMIEHCKDGSYKVRNCNGKAIIHKDFSDAVKLAIETAKKFSKFNKAFDRGE